MKEFSSKELVESFGYEQTVSEAGTLAAGAKLTGKMAGKALPFVGTALSAEDALSRWQSGDKSGAVISTLAGLGYLIPGPAGWIVGGGLDALKMYRDGVFSGEDDSAAIASSEKPDSNANLTALQKIIGAKPDGVFGPETKNKLMKWQASKGIKVDGIPGPETYTAAGLMENTTIMTQTLGEKIAAIRDKLATLDQESTLSENAAETIWQAAKAGARSVDDIIAALTKDGHKIPANIQKWGQHAIDSVAKKSAPIVNQPSKMAPDLARLQGSKEALSGIKAQELAAREAAIARMSPNELAKAGLSPTEQQSIRRSGLIAWVKQNPKKSAAVLAALGLGTAMLGTTTSSGGMPSTSGAPSTGSVKRGDPDIMKKQEMLNALTGSNLKIDGIWGPETQAAADKWYGISAAQNADMKSQLDAIPKSPTAPISEPVEPPTPPESDAYKDVTRNVPKAVSESDELARIIQLLK